MHKGNNEATSAVRTYELLSAGAEAELRLLKQERKAEKRLADALATLAEDERRLQRAKQRVARSGDAVSAAEASLHEAQARRAEGPIADHD